jgi:hypothetical protein
MSTDAPNHPLTCLTSMQSLEYRSSSPSAVLAHGSIRSSGRVAPHSGSVVIVHVRNLRHIETENQINSSVEKVSNRMLSRTNPKVAEVDTVIRITHPPANMVYTK